jgi:uncharacterized protein (TIGR03790 family)
MYPPALRACLLALALACPNSPAQPAGSAASQPATPDRPNTDSSAEENPVAWPAHIATVVIYNSNDPDAEALAHLYADARQVPQTRIVALDCPATETISRQEYEETIRTPLMRHFSKEQWWQTGIAPDGQPVVTSSNVRILALIRGMPLRIKASPRAEDDPPAGPQDTDQASVDAALSALPILNAPKRGPLNNPYFRKDLPFSQVPVPSLLVARLDAPSVETARRMLRDAIATESAGLWGWGIFDLARKGGGYTQGDDWISAASTSARDFGFPTYTDSHPDLIPHGLPLQEVALYFGWYTQQPYPPFFSQAPDANPDPSSPHSDAPRPSLFSRGAVAVHLHSFSATTMRDPAAAWAPALVERGATATLGNTWEPFLGLTAHFDIFLDRLLKGYTLAEAAWMATPALSWQNVVIGDPLYRPFAPNEALADETIARAFKIYLLAHRQWGGQGASSDQFTRALLDAHERTADHTLLEMLGTRFLASEEPGLARQFFERAATAQQDDPAAKLRNLLFHVESLRADGRPEDALDLLRPIRDTFPQDARTTIDHILRPLLPPPPTTPHQNPL